MGNKKTGVEPFEPEDELEEDSDENNSEDEMAKETAKAKSRRASEVEEDDEDETDEDEATDEVDDEAEDEDDDETDDEDEEEDDYANFKPFIVHEEQEWDLDEVLGNADGGEVVTLYHLESGHWYKLQPIKVGEVPES